MNSAMHYKIINPALWDTLLVQFDDVLWCQKSINIEEIARTYNRKAVYFAAYHQSVFCAAMVLFVDRKKANLPTHFFYTPFFINRSLKDFIINQSLQQMLLELKKEYHQIELKLAPKYNDIRPFSWSGFDHKIYYTLIKDLQNTTKKPSENIRRQLNKIAQNNAIVVKVEEENLADIFNKHIEMMIQNGLSKVESKSVLSWLNFFNQNKQLYVFGLYESDILHGSALLTFDQEQAYLISITGGVAETFGQTALYFALFNHFQSLGINKIDLLGANIQGVAEYKSKLGSELHSYPIVSYHKYKAVNQLKLKLKKWLKKHLN